MLLLKKITHKKCVLGSLGNRLSAFWKPEMIGMVIGVVLAKSDQCFTIASVCKRADNN